MLGKYVTVPSLRSRPLSCNRSSLPYYLHTFTSNYPSQEASIRADIPHPLVSSHSSSNFQIVKCKLGHQSGEHTREGR